MTLKKKKADFWVVASLLVLALYVIFMVVPMIKVFYQALLDPTTKELSITNFRRFFTTPYYSATLVRSFKVAVSVAFFSLLVGIPLAYLYNMYQIRGKKLIQMLIILSSMSAPFIGAYSWILLFGNSGVITQWLQGFGIQVGSIYGFKGIVLVLTTKMYPLVFLYLSGAIKNIDSSLLEASANMGRTGLKRFVTVVLPLCMPTILAAALMVFMRALADFGTAMMIGQGYMTFPLVIYNEFVGEVGVNKNFASAVSVIAIVITLIVFLIQSWATRKTSFSMSAMHHIEPKKPGILGRIFINLYINNIFMV